jgi:two-component system chemotaxis sensor kinase CheA
MLAIVSVGEGSYALRVDDVLDNEELVIKPAAPAIMATGVYAGQTLPDSGRPMLLLDCGGIARDAGLQFVHDVLAEEEEDAVEAEAVGVQALVFIDLDGARRAVPLGVVDRIEQVSADAIRHAAGRMRLTIDGRIIPLAARSDLTGAASWSVLRLKDGVSEIGYAIAEAADIVTLPAEIVAAGTPGPIAGAVLLDGEPVELLDPHWLFAEHGEAGASSETAPLCLLTGGEDGWMRTFVQPMLETAGYRVTLDANETADVVLALDSAADAHAAKAPVVRLRSKRGCEGDGSIWRYDRDALLGALASVARGK